MPQFIRIIFALTMCMLFGAACAVEEDSAADTELTIASNVADRKRPVNPTLAAIG